MNSTPLTDQPILAYGIALGIGLLIGAERERRKGIGPTRSAMGIRTFSTTSLLGAVSLTLGGSALLAVMALAVAGLTAMAFRLSQEQDPGLTTEVALLLTLLLGGLAMREPALASGLAVILTILLTARSFLHRFVSTILSETELNDALILAAAALVLLPPRPRSVSGPIQCLESPDNLEDCYPHHGHQRHRVHLTANNGAAYRSSYHGAHFRLCVECRHH